jgi:hypothetical protein
MIDGRIIGHLASATVAVEENLPGLLRAPRASVGLRPRATAVLRGFSRRPPVVTDPSVKPRPRRRASAVASTGVLQHPRRICGRRAAAVVTTEELLPG